MNSLPNLSLFYQLAYFTDDGISAAINFTLGTHTAIRWCRFAVSAASSLRSIALDLLIYFVFPTQRPTRTFGTQNLIAVFLLSQLCTNKLANVMLNKR